MVEPSFGEKTIVFDEKYQTSPMSHIRTSHFGHEIAGIVAKKNYIILFFNFYQYFK
jgi:hypothetical protein